MATYSIDHNNTGWKTTCQIISEAHALEVISMTYDVPVSELVLGDWELWSAGEDGDEDRKLVWLSEELARNDDGKNAACQITRSR